MTPLEILNQYKSPRDKQNYIGLEMEFLMNPDQYEQRMMYRRTLEENFIAQGLEDKVNFGYESITCGEGPTPRGWEAKILCLESDYRTPLRKFIKAIKESKASVNEYCGLHVHIDMRSRKPQECYERLLEAQDMLFGMCATHRMTNRYCAPNTSKTMGIEGHKLSAINTRALSKFGSLEVRMHESILRVKPVIDWVKTLVDIVGPPNTFGESLRVAAPLRNI